MADTLTYRFAEARDVPALLSLWDAAGWGSLTPDQWREWFVDGPHGEYLVAVAVDERGGIVAQEMFAPSRVLVGGRELEALRFSAPIMRKDRRGTSLRQEVHPLVGLYKFAASEAPARGFSVVYALPDAAWLPVLRIAPRFGVPSFAEAAYPCVALPLDAAPVAGPGAAHTAAPAADLGEEYDALWASAREAFPITCGVVRDRRLARSRNSGRLILEVRDGADGSLVGYSATKVESGLLADVLARHPDDVTAVVASSLRWLSGERGMGVPAGLTHVKAMRTPFVAGALDALGFAPDDFTFAFACNTFDAGVPPCAIAADRWYVTAGD